MNKIKGIVFDLDHTLFNRYATFDALQDSFYDAFKKYLSESVTPRDICIAIKDGDKNHLYEGWDFLARYVFSLGYFKVKITESEFKRIVLSCFANKAIPYDFTIPTLEKLQSSGYRLGLITNGASELQRKKISMLNLENLFDEIIISGEFGKSKPDISIFYEMSNRLNIECSSLFYVGDHPINDIDAASRAGYKTIWVKSNGNWVVGCKKPTFEVENISEVLKILGI